MIEDSGNYLTAWYDQMRLVKWQKVLHEDKFFKSLEGIRTEIELFFDPTDFNKSSKINPDNWLLHVLANQQLNLIYVLNETTELLKYQKSIPDVQQYRLKNNEGKVNFKAFQEKLYEIYIHYILSSSGLNPEIGHSYKSGKGFSKEVDILLKFENCSYNFEITKYYDGFKEELLSLATTILEILRNTTFKRSMFHEMFSGYFAFKTRNAVVIRKNKDTFETRIKNLLHGYRAGGDVISYPAKIVNEDYKFDLEPAFNKHFEQNYKEMLKI